MSSNDGLYLLAVGLRDELIDLDVMRTLGRGALTSSFVLTPTFFIEDATFRDFIGLSEPEF